MVTVVVCLAVLVVQEHACRQPRVEMYAAVEVHLLSQPVVEICVRADTVSSLGLEVFYVYLSCDALIAVLHAARTLADLYALEPWPGHIAERVGDAGTTKVGHVLCKHLHIRPAEPQELYLASACRGVAVRDIDRGIRRERLAKVAACGADKLALAYHLGVRHAE